MNAIKDGKTIRFLDNVNFLIKESTKVKNKQALANAIKISSVAFRNMEKRGTSPSLDVATKCADFFGISLDDIIYKDLPNTLNKKKITIPLYQLSNLKEPINTVHISMKVQENSFALLMTENDSLMYSGDIFIVSQGEQVKNYDYIVISCGGKNYIKQIRYRNLDVLFTDIDSGDQYEFFKNYQIIGVVVSKIIN